jgi:hypothetical protein
VGGLHTEAISSASNFVYSFNCISKTWSKVFTRSASDLHVPSCIAYHSACGALRPAAMEGSNHHHPNPRQQLVLVGGRVSISRLSPTSQGSCPIYVLDVGSFSWIPVKVLAHDDNTIATAPPAILLQSTLVCLDCARNQYGENGSYFLLFGGFKSTATDVDNGAVKLSFQCVLLS